MESSIISFSELKNAIKNYVSPIYKGPEAKLSLKLGEINYVRPFLGGFSPVLKNTKKSGQYGTLH